MKETRQAHQSFSQDLTKLMSELSVLKDKVKKNPSEIKKFFTERLSPIAEGLIMEEEKQKQDNKSSQEIMTEIKRENAETTESMARTFEKVSFR